MDNFNKIDEVLINMGMIVAHEQALKAGAYITPNSNVTDPLCGGANVCAIGSLYVAAGVRPKGAGIVHLPGVCEHDREAFMEDKPVLAKAYTLLNDAAVDFADEHDISVVDGSFDSQLEALFETGWGVEPEWVETNPDNYPYTFDRNDLLTVIESARKLLREETV